MPDNQGSSIDLLQFKLEQHVEEAFRIALLVSQGRPLSAGDLLNSALLIKPRKGFSAFSKWASFFPPGNKPPLPYGLETKGIIDRILINSFLAASFQAARSFRGNTEIWGRDYITLALLAVGDPSLFEIAAAAKRSIESLRDEWFRFVTSQTRYPDHRPWAQWWQEQGVQIPVASQATQIENQRTGAYLLTWDPKRHPADRITHASAQLEREGKLVMNWSVGNHGARRGDRVFFMRHGDNQPGLIGSGSIVGNIGQGLHWDRNAPPDWIAYYADVQWEVLRPLPLISLDELVKRTGENKLWTETGSGLPIPLQLAVTLESLWKEALLSQSQASPSNSAAVPKAATAVTSNTATLTVTMPSNFAPVPKAAAAAASAGGVAPQAQVNQASTTVVEPEAARPQSHQDPAIDSEQQPPRQAAAPEPVPTRLPDVWMLSDRPLEERFAEQDRFQFNDYANALAAIIDHDKTETPFTMAINAPWGAGKTTLANMIAEQLQQRPIDRGHEPHIICRFNAWMHDDAPNLATAFVSEVGRTADPYRSRFWRIFRPLPAALLDPRSRKWRGIMISLPLLTIVLLAAWSVASHLQRVDEYKKGEASKSETHQVTTTTMTDPSGTKTSNSESTTHSNSSVVLPDPGKPSSLGKMDSFVERFQSNILVLGAFITALAGVLGLLTKVLSSTALGGFVQSPDKAAETGAIQAAQKQLRELISQATWRGNKFIVFVDDIERCTPPRSVDILDAVNQLMDHKNVVVVFLGDMSAVAAAVQLKYKDLAEIFVPSAGIAQTGPDRGKEAFGRLYLQKIIQFQFDLPIPPMNKIQAYLQQLAVTPLATGDGNGRA